MSNILLTPSVTINLEESSTSASLAFISDPNRLENNKKKAMKVYNQELWKLNLSCNAKDKQNIIEPEGKLQQLVEYLNNLPDDMYKNIFETIQYNISFHDAQFGRLRAHHVE